MTLRSGSSWVAQPSIMKTVAMTTDSSDFMPTRCLRKMSRSEAMHSAAGGRSSHLRMWRWKLLKSSTISSTNCGLVGNCWMVAICSDVSAMLYPSRALIPSKKEKRLLRSWLVSEVDMPVSSITMCGLGTASSSPKNFACTLDKKVGSLKRIRMLPGCKSACTKLSSSSILKSVFRPICASFLFHGCSSPKILLKMTPSSKVSTRTSFET
mmetsp:Transcript_8236/g.21132  ORF Transcript_8236/g.21132 Transcript_8236/m.21132 type:complete len:210 (+) Transcript_8236:741-1370(+)